VNQGVQEVRGLTRKVMVWSPVTEGSHGGRNSRIFPPEMKK
jgi:hypothetical protein